MKKILLTLSLLALTGSALAQHHGHGFRHHGHHGYYYGGGNGNWVAPLIIGGFVGAAIANNRQPETIVLQRPPVYIQQPPMVYQQNQNCTPWTETYSSDGTITRTRTCTQ